MILQSVFGQAHLAMTVRTALSCLVVILLAFCCPGRVDAPSMTAATRPAESTPVNATPARPITPVGDVWAGTSRPAPGQYLRMTRAYRSWRERFVGGLDGVSHRKRATAALELRQWLDAYEVTAAGQVASDRMSVSRSAVTPLYRIPALRRAVGPPPVEAFERFYGYKIVLPWNHAVYCYPANAIPADTPYLLHPEGVRDGGVPISQRADIHLLFACAGVTDPKAKDVLIKVSQREGGFEAINTWDTGYVSVGFLQFTTGELGTGSLIHVLQRMKTDEERLARHRGHLDEFQQYFAGHGIDVQNGKLIVCDPRTGRSFSGADAVQLIIQDKRLTAILQDAGAKSRAFQLAQIREACGAYYLANAPFRIPAAEVNIYEVPATGMVQDESNAAICRYRLIKIRYVYGQDAVRQALADGINPDRLDEQVQQAATGTLIRTARRLPDLSGTYGEVLSSEGGMVTLTDRAVQCGVHDAMATFEHNVSALAVDHPLTLADLRASEQVLIAGVKNRIDVLANNPAPPVTASD